MKKSRKRKSKKRVSFCKVRIFCTLIVFGIVTAVLGSNCYSNIKKIREMNDEKKRLEEKVLVLQEEKEILETDILKLKDDEYIAKYVREKYYFSKDGELILKID